jgi:hypothetical protein
MNMTQTKELTTLFLDKKATYGIRKGTEFLPKGATIVAVFTKFDGVVTSISQAYALVPACDTSELRPQNSEPSAARCFGNLWEQAVDPHAIISFLNGKPYHIDDVGERGKKLTEIIYELIHGHLPTPSGDHRRTHGQFENSLR